jgi:cytidine deaminase
MKPEQIKQLIKKANEALKFSYSPYSNYPVGAAILTKNGQVFTGTNIENATYPAGICAERAAVATAVSVGVHEFEAIAIVSKDENNHPYPCGICRQTLHEFSPNMKVIIAKSENDYEEYCLSELLPHSFTLKK